MHLLYRTYAKVNFSLEILGKREDGFHALASLAHAVNLGDDLRIEPDDEILTRVEGMDLDPETNLVWRAASLLAGFTRERRGAKLTLVKRIPAAAGLGGGSSDAATTLVGLNQFWQSGVHVRDLEELAARLGSDVPFFVRGGAALMQGRGEQLEPLPALEHQWLVLVVPSHDVEDKTRRLYAALTPADYATGEASRGAAEKLQRGEPLSERDCVNGFTRAAREVFPGLAETWASIERQTQRRFFLSGAGPALFAFAADRRDASSQLARLGGSLNAFAVRTVKHARASIAVASE